MSNENMNIVGAGQDGRASCAPKAKKILVACECSGRVRDAFIARGFDAMSCDLKPTEVPGPHYQGSVFDVLNNGWDLLIGHPPCTYLTYAGTRHWSNPGRCEKRLDALDFFRRLWEAPIKHICLENPAGCASPTIAKFAQEIQPYFFGESAQKRTWLWLRNLPVLQKTNVVKKPEPMYICQGEKCKGKKIYWAEGIRGEGDRSTARSRTFQGIADAMADQWGAHLLCANSPAQNTMGICHTAPNSAILQGLKPHAGNTGTSAVRQTLYAIGRESVIRGAQHDTYRVV